MNIKVATCFNVLQYSCLKYIVYFSIICSGLDKDLDQSVFHPLLFDLMSILLPTKNIKLQKMQSLVKRPNICLIYTKEKLLVLNTCCIFRKTSKI